MPVLALRYVIPLSSKQPLKNLLCAGRDLGRSDWVSFFRAFICSYFAEESLDHGKNYDGPVFWEGNFLDRISGGYG